jgi:UPF0755 protein
MSKRFFLTIGIIASLLFGAAAGYATWAWHIAHLAYRGYDESEIVVDIGSGQGAQQILNHLEEKGVIRSALLARFYLQLILESPSLLAGEYSFTEPLNTPQILAKLMNGEVITHPVTVMEGLTIEETAKHLADSGFGQFESFMSLVSSPDFIVDWDPEAVSLEGYLFPDTYSFARNTTERVVIQSMVETFRRRCAYLFEDLAQDEQKSLRQIVTLASIVEKEAQVDSERPTIAGVYANRLRIGMALYADPTVIYGLKLLGRWDGNLRRKDLAVESPYNTYRNAGLPPGPIASPGLASLKAAAAPADVKYLYFVSRNDGTHVFAESLAEHNRNVYRWQKLYWRKRWAEEAQKDAKK